MTERERIPEDQIARARDVDIVSLVGRSVALKRRGRMFWGLCPFHKEKSPSFKVDNERRAYHCFGCGAGGDAIAWLMKMEAMSFADAVRALIGNGALPETKRERPAYAPKPVEDRKPFQQALHLWNTAKSAKGTVIEEYLRVTRAIRLPISDELRFAPRLMYGPTKQHYRVMLARVSDDRGFCAVQRTFLYNDRPEKIKIPNPDRNGKFLPPKLTKGPMRGGAVRIRMPVGDVLGLAEGLETAYSAAQLYSVPVWATCGGERLQLIEIPKTIKRLVIFGDNKEAGRNLAFAAQDFYEQRRGLAVEVIFPQAHFDCAEEDDFNDILKKNLPRRSVHRTRVKGEIVLPFQAKSAGDLEERRS